MPGSSPHGALVLRRLRVVSAILLVTFCAVVAIITFWPGPPDPDGQRALRIWLVQAHTRGLPSWITFGKIEFAANILMFVPIGLFGALSLARMRRLIVPAGIAASIAIEVIQATKMPDRVGTPRDVLANAIGALVGYLMAGVLVWMVRSGARRRAIRRPGTAGMGTVVHIGAGPVGTAGISAVAGGTTAPNPVIAES